MICGHAPCVGRTRSAKTVDITARKLWSDQVRFAADNSTGPALVAMTWPLTTTEAAYERLEEIPTHRDQSLVQNCSEAHNSRTSCHTRPSLVNIEDSW